MNEQDIKSVVKSAIQEVFEESRSISEQVHHDDHEFVALLKEERQLEKQEKEQKEKRRQELVQSFKKSAVGAITVALFGWLSGLGDFVMGVFK